MTILINFKICDNSPDCNWISSCPKKAFYFDEARDTIAVDEKLCTNCGICMKSCLVGAIKCARTKEEENIMRKEIDDDPRKWNDLFVDRYWATPISDVFTIKPEEFDRSILEPKRLVVLEVYDDDSIECLIKSIPVKELFPQDIIYRKMLVEDDNFFTKYWVITLPSLLFFNSWELIGKISWFYWVNKKDVLINKIEDIVKDL